MSSDLDILVREEDGLPIIELAGDVDTYTCSRLRAAIMRLIEEGQFKMVVNMASVKYIDSAGLGIIVGGLRRVAEHEGGIALAGANEQIKRVLNITGLARIIDLFEDEDEAIRNLKKIDRTETREDK